MFNGKVPTEAVIDLAPAVLQVCTPLVGAAASHHYTRKEMELEKEVVVEKAERRKESLQQLGGGRAHPGQPAPQQQPQQPAQPGGNVYDRLRQMRAQTECDFCKSTIDRLLESDEELAARGESELREYMQKTETLVAANASRDKMEQEMAQLADGWEVIPEVMASG